MHTIPYSRPLAVLAICMSAGLTDLGESADAVPTSNAVRIRKVIERLPSRNRPPEKSGWRVAFPKDYDNEAQTVVYLAMRCLLGEGADGVDELILHFDDARYAYSYEAPDGVHNATVGDTCRRLAKRIVLAYEPEMLPLSSHQASALWAGKDFQVWWNTNRHRPLWELQIAAIDAQLEAFKNLRHESASPPHPSAAKLSAEEFELRRKQNVARLEEIKSCVASTKRAWVAVETDDVYAAMTGVTWPTRNFGK